MEVGILTREGGTAGIGLEGEQCGSPASQGRGREAEARSNREQERDAAERNLHFTETLAFLKYYGTGTTSSKNNGNGTMPLESSTLIY